jgi:hypothetical protein
VKKDEDRRCASTNKTEDRDEKRHEKQRPLTPLYEPEPPSEIYRESCGEVKRVGDVRLGPSECDAVRRDSRKEELAAGPY